MLRTAGRLVLAIVGLFVAIFVWQSPDMIIYQAGKQGSAIAQPPYRQALGAALYIAVTLFIVYVLYTRLDHRSWQELALPFHPGTMVPSFAWGFLVGAVIFALIPLSQWLLGAVEFDGYLWEVAGAQNWMVPFWVFPLGGVFTYVAVGFSEELFFRGYIFRTLQYRHGFVAALWASAVVFSVVHLINGGFTFLVFVNIVLIGITFVYMVLYYKNLWVPMGFHAAWDWVQSNVLQVNTSAEAAERSFVTFVQRPEASAFLAGSQFGSETTILATVVIVTLLLYYRWRVNTAWR